MSEEQSLNFIEEIVEADLAAGKYQSIIYTLAMLKVFV
jgi:hypothetical protein